MIKEFEPEKDYQQRARDTRYGSCGRKASYRTEKQAKKAAEKISSRLGILVTYYKCRFCEKFHHTKANDDKGNNSMDLPSEFHGKEVFNDARGPYIKVDMICRKCGGVEQGIRRLSVVGNQYTRAQSIIPIDSSNIIHPHAGSKEWEHRICPLSDMSSSDLVPDLVEQNKDDKQPLKTTTKHPDLYSVELAFSPYTILELLEVLNPNNPISDAFARGAAWTFIKDLSEKIMKK